MAVGILGLGTALPGSVISTQQFIDHAKRFSCQSPKQERVLEELYRRTEISSRASVLASYAYGTTGDAVFRSPAHPEDRGAGTSERMTCYERESAPLAIAAAERALLISGLDRSTITHTVTVSCTGFYAPGFDIELIQDLGLPPETQRTHVGFMGCHGAMNGLRAAAAYANSDPNARVLLCASELCSLHFQYGWSTDKLVANSLFSDGAAALVIGQSNSSSQLTHVDSSSVLIPNTRDMMRWRIGDHGFEMHLSTGVPDVVSSHLPQWIDAWLFKNGLKRAEIEGWAVHPGGPRILDAVQDCLQLGDDALKFSRAILAECGNMSSPTVLFILERILSVGVKGPMVVLGFGPGLTVEAALLRAQ